MRLLRRSREWAARRRWLEGGLDEGGSDRTGGAEETYAVVHHPQVIVLRQTGTARTAAMRSSKHRMARRMEARRTVPRLFLNEVAVQFMKQNAIAERARREFLEGCIHKK